MLIDPTPASAAFAGIEPPRSAGFDELCDSLPWQLHHELAVYQHGEDPAVDPPARRGAEARPAGDSRVAREPLDDGTKLVSAVRSSPPLRIVDSIARTRVRSSIDGARSPDE